MNVFESVGIFLDGSLALLQNATLNDKFVALQTTISILITLSIMYKGYMVLAGKSSDPIRELVWDIARKLLILTFALNVNGWLTMANEALRGLYEWAGNSSVLYSKLDELLLLLLEKIEIVYKKINFLGGNLFGCIFLILVMFLVFAVVVFQYFFSIITTSLTNTILVLVFPIALICFMYNQTKQVFMQWANMFLANLITLTLLTFVLKLVINGLFGAIDLNEQDDNYFRMAFHTLFTGASLVMLVMLIKSIAKSLASVSLDEASTGAMTMMSSVSGGAAGFAMGKALGGVGMLGNLSKASINAGLQGAIKAAGQGGSRGLGFMKGASGINAGYEAFNKTKSQFKNTLSKLRNGTE